METSYTGRFAPSPTGPLHFGSLVAAIGSFLDARAVGGRWLLRIEDVDTPRCSMAAARDIVETLSRFGLEWDGSITRQSERNKFYRDSLNRLIENNRVFPCACTRKELADSSLAHDGARIYPGTCRNGLPSNRKPRAWRFHACGTVDFMDRVQGFQHEDLARDTGDYVVLRADGLFAYQLAVVVDDAEAGVTQVVRGADLLYSTARQIALQAALGVPTPVHAHLPVAVNAAGEKLSKQTLAMAVRRLPPSKVWLAALQFLGQNPPDELAHLSLQEIRDWAISRWDMESVSRTRTLPTPQLFLSQAHPLERQS